MKSNIKIFAMLLAMIISSVTFTKQASAQQPYVSFQVFYDQLSPYGQWLDNPDYGYVWIPYAGSDFAPYSTRGHWILTDYGWTWISDYDWGWAPFHYGRWNYDNYYGWYWIPDNEWGPAWVTWRRASGYYGWTPMRPGISINLSFGMGYDSQNDHWIFVRDRYLDRPNINRYYANRIDHDRIIRNSTVINNTYVDNRRQTTYISGPGREDVQKVTGRRLSPATVQEYNRPGQEMSNGQLRIYRPQVIRNNDNGQKPVPSRITNMDEIKRPSERNAANRQQNVNPTTNTRVQQQNTVNPQNNNIKNNNEKSSKQQNVNQSNNRREQQPVSVKPSDKNKNEQQKKSKSEQKRKRTI